MFHFQITISLKFRKREGFGLPEKQQQIKRTKKLSKKKGQDNLTSEKNHDISVRIS